MIHCPHCSHGIPMEGLIPIGTYQCPNCRTQFPWPAPMQSQKLEPVMLGSNFKVRVVAATKDLLYMSTIMLHDKQEEQLVTEVLNLKGRAVREALIHLGWTPPPEDELSCGDNADADVLRHHVWEAVEEYGEHLRQQYRCATCGQTSDSCLAVCKGPV